MIGAQLPPHQLHVLLNNGYRFFPALLLDEFVGANSKRHPILGVSGDRCRFEGQ